MISTKITDALNAQINAELWSAYLYLAMAMDFEAKGLAGVANWFRIQFKEEQDHAEIFINYLVSRGARVTLKPIAGVQERWGTTLSAFESTLAHEQEVTAMVEKLYALAEEEKDYATRIMLNWFVSEQVEEEQTAQGMIDRLKLVGEEGQALYMFDRELAERKYHTPSPLAK